MPGPIKPRANVARKAGIVPKAIGSRTDTGSIEMSPKELNAAGAVSVKNGVLTVKNEHLANLIHAKLASASAMVPGGKAATDVDISVGIKIK